ncbi:MAG: LacI family DNA-binding transcriptional regulator [Oscillospiraceae bacterium]|nr:LacI family DNA-binding transcriptional regulator [Oscillospiraceae bacterium]
MSLKKIAAIVGVSPSTVSRVLNNTSSTCASPALQAEIWRVARELNYTPDANARRLRAGTRDELPARHISLVLARIRSLEDDPFFSELCRCLETELFAAGCLLDHVIFADDEQIVQELSPTGGAVILGRCSAALLDRIRAVTRSVVGIWRNPMDFDVDEVVCDGKQAATLAVEYLIGLGHRRIAYIGDCSYESRYVGYCDTLIRHRLSIDYRAIIPTDQTEAAGQAAMGRLLAADSCTAVLCANDITAIGALQTIRKQRRPISVIAIDNIERSAYTDPMLTTVNIPRSDMAHHAVRLLLDRMDRKHSEFVRVELPCRIIERESCNPVKPGPLRWAPV